MKLVFQKSIIKKSNMSECLDSLAKRLWDNRILFDEEKQRLENVLIDVNVISGEKTEIVFVKHRNIVNQKEKNRY